MHSEITSLNIRAILLLSVFILLMCGSAFAGTVVVKPGQFDHFTLQMPERAVAGENFVIRASVYDANNNLITNFSETGKEFKIEVSGSATAQPSVLGASAFSGGIANVLVNNRKAEKITFSIRESGGSVPVISREIVVVPNKLNHFVLQSPPAVTAGKTFDVKIVARDVFENTVGDIDIGKNIKVTSSGTSSVNVLGSGAFDFRHGLATAGFVAEKTGDVAIEIQDSSSGSRGKTQSIQVNPAALALFKLQAPKAAVAGEPFELLIAAYDTYDNIVTNYASSGSGVKLTTTGSSKVEPVSVNPTEFRNGQATVKATYERAEDVQIIAKEADREQSGKTAGIQITNAAPDHFVVLTPDTAISGQKFKIKVEAYDRFNNLVKNFNLVGSDVALGTTGSGTLAPSRIAPSDFAQGIAVADVMYDKVESFQISARMSADKAPGRIAVSEREAKREVAHVPAPVIEKQEVRKDVTPGAAPAKAKKDIKDESRQPVSEKPKPKAAVIKEPKTEQKKETGRDTVRKETPRKAEVRKEEPKKEAVTKAAPKKEEPKKEAAIREVPRKIEPPKQPDSKVTLAKPAEERQPAAKAVIPSPQPAEKKAVAEEAKKPPMELAKREEKKDDKPLLYTLSNVSIIEAKSKAMLVLNITSPNGTLDYGDEIESKYGKEWLKLRMNPAVNSTDKSFKFKSSYIGEVRIEEDKTGGKNVLNVFIELIPSGVTYDIARVKNTLVVTFSQP